MAVAAALAALSLALVAPAPSYDPWMWLLWGREVAEASLDTHDGPAFKPLPVAVCALLAPLGAAAPVAWVLLVRTAGLVAVYLAWRVGRRLAGGSRLAGALAAAAVLLCGRLIGFTASGTEPALVLAAALGGVEAWAAGRHRLALACAAACGLLRVEAWPFLLAGGVVLWRRAPQHRPALGLAAVVIPAAWFGPEWLGSGDLLRSGARARIPNPGQPALAAVPALASLRAGLALVPWPLWAGVAALAVAAGRERRAAHPRAVGAAARRPGRSTAAAARPALVLGGAGAAWLLLVALMAQAGFSGEPRYALPGAALIGIAGAVGLGSPAARRPRHSAPRTDPIGVPLPRPPGHVAAPAAAIDTALPPPPRRVTPRAVALGAALLLAVPAAVRLAELPALRAAQTYQWRLAAELADVIGAAGGRAAVLACGTPYVGPRRGPVMAYTLRVRKAAVEPDDPPRAPGMVFRSRLTADAPPAPAAPATFAPVARTPRWRVLAACPAP